MDQRQNVACGRRARPRTLQIIGRVAFACRTSPVRPGAQTIRVGVAARLLPVGCGHRHGICRSGDRGRRERGGGAERWRGRLGEIAPPPPCKWFPSPANAGRKRGACGSTSSPRTQFCSGPYFNAALLVCRLMLVAWSNSFTKIVLRSLQLRIKTYIDAVAGPAGAGNRGRVEPLSLEQGFRRE